MANWIRTILKITGSDADIVDFTKRTIKLGTDLGFEGWSELGFDFRAIIPTPDDKNPTSDWAEEHWGSDYGFDLEITEERPGRGVWN